MTSERRSDLLFLLLFGCLLAGRVADARRKSLAADSRDFTFTAAVYNVSLEENARGTQYASSDDPLRMGVPMPDSDSNVRFKIVEGDKNHLFKANARQVGDFVFLRIRQRDKNDMPLNRELKDHYEFLVKATCKRKRLSNLETTTVVRLRVTDRNDASPMFTLDADQYEATVPDDLSPFSKVLRIEASDADIGINGEIYYSLVNRSADFFVDPVTGWIRTLRPLHAGSYSLKAKAEDRTSRIFYYDEEQKQPGWTTDVVITVVETKRPQLHLLVEKRPIESFRTDTEQLAAIIRLKGGNSSTRVGLVEDDLRHWFHLNRTNDHWQLYTIAGRVIPDGTNVSVSAGNPVGTEENTTATIRIETITKHGVSFGQTRISFSVQENSPIGYVVGRISAEVSNSADRDLVRYHLESLDQDTVVPFRLGEETGLLRVAKEIDFEVNKKYQFNVFAKLSGLGDQSSVLVEVFITDANDHSPVFAAKWTRQAPVAVGDNLEIGTTLLKVDAVDLDSGDNGKIGYKLSSEQQPPLPFDVDFETGEIRLASPLPKAVNSWPVTVWAVDWGHPLPRSSAVNLVFYRNGTKVPPKPRSVSLTDLPNKHSPRFEDSLKKVTVKEDAKLGSLVATLVASDGDHGYNGLIRYTTWDEYFAIDAKSGDISVACDLSQLVPAGTEKIIHEVDFIASDQGQPVNSVKKTVKMEILDVNNKAPKFDQKWYRTRLPEDTPVGKTVLMVSAQDEDFGEAGRVGYRLAESQEGYLSIDETTGKISVRETMDRETQDVIRYTLVAFDHGTPQRMTFVNLTIEVADVNDNAPFCVERVTRVRIPEDYPSGALVGCIAARDRDEGANARLRYTIDNPVKPPFRIDHHTGCVFIHSPHRPLDYQIQPLYNITIDVADNGESVLSSTCQLEVELLDEDENLHAPEFDDVAHEASVYENMPIGTEVFTVIASDPDKKDAKLRYSIVGGDGVGYFAIDSKGTIRTLSVLDREERRQYWLAVGVADDAVRPRSAVLHLFIRVLDKNDHRPVAKQPIYFASVKENSAQNVVVVKLEASDGDDIDGDAQPLQYKIVRGDPQSFFRMDAATGYITTSGSRRLDRETQREHELWVRVCDGGEPQLCSEVPVVVAVEDLNDNAPVFTQPIHHYNVLAGETGVVCRVFAVDSDSGVNAELYYNITDGDARFSINENGYISTAEPLGGDEVFPLTIQTTDKGLPAQLAQTRVVLTGAPRPKRVGANRAPRIKDRGNLPPIPISDADQVGLTIGMMEASDEDGDPSWWSIVGGNVGETFAVRADSGALLLAKHIEQLPAGVGEIVLTLRVTDGEKSDEMKVPIELSRSPSTRPQFSAQHYRTQISEKTAIGTQIYTVAASVESTGTIGKPVVYSIFSVEDTSMEDKLRVEPSTGNVLVMESLDFEACREINLVVAARQGGLANFATLSVAITDDNDNAPRFMRKEYDVKVAVSTPIGAVVQTLLAHDADSGDNGVVKYSILSGNELGFFSLDPSTGEIRVAKRLSEEYSESILTVRATDGGKYAMTDTATVRLQTTADVEHGIRFTRPIYQRSVPESTPVGSIVLVVSTEPNGHAKYSIRRPCPYFDVHPLSGAVSLAKWLTQERAKSIECTIEAEGRDAEKQTAKIIVKPTNTNQHSPVFRSQIYEGTIRENSPIGSAVLLSDHSPLIVSAWDRDSGPNSLVGYRPLKEDPHFVVDFVSGAIRSRRPLDYEKMKKWSFYVQASDMGQPVRTSPMPALVTVHISDENDESPAFNQSLYETALHLPTVAGVRVASPLASDVDVAGKLRYYLKSKNLQKLFSVNALDGSVSTATDDSKAFTEKEYKLTVGVTDGVHSASSIVVVKIISTPVSKGFRCAQQEYTATVVENKTFDEGQYLTAVTAIDGPEGAPVTYTLLTERDEFLLNRGTGVVALAGPALDRERESTIRLLVQARSHEPVPSLANCLITIKVDDVNDSAPKFVSLPYDVIVAADAKTGDTVLAVKAIDADYGANGMVQYSSPDIPKEFRLNKHDGKIAVNSRLIDTRVHEFTVEARDLGEPPLRSSTLVRIEVVEKARPLFSQRRYTANVAPTAKIGTTITSVSAVSNTNGHLVYSIENGNTYGLFDIEPDTGSITVARALDVEEIPVYNLTVMATDVNRDQMQSTAVVQIEISGINDKSPVFSSPVYRIQVRESTPKGAELITVSAVGSNGNDDVITYAAQGKDAEVISVDIESGMVSLAAMLDYEKKKRYDVTLVAADASQRMGKARLVIEIEDVNDEPPRFSQPFAVADLSDTAETGQFVAIMSVTDEDAVSSLPDGHRLLYSVIDGDETLFNVDKHTGEVTTARPLDEYDIIDSPKRLNVSVSDGVFTAYGQLTVSVSVSGKRQPPPRFEQSQYVAAVRENSAADNHSILLTVRARDGVPPIHYSIGGGKEYRAWPVRIDKTTGKVQQRKGRGRDKENNYVIPLIAEDALGRRAFSTLTLNVVRENDHPPKFVVNKYTCTVSSNSKSGDPILMVSASDPDEGDTIEYSLLGEGDAGKMFTIHSRQGTVTLKGAVDKYVDSSLSFVVKATDMANPPHHSTAEVSVSVLSPEVAVPRFSNSHYLFNVAEDAPVGTVIGKLQQIETAVEAVRFSLMEVPDGFPLMIERSSGRLIVRGVLDREQVAEWRFAVRADAPRGAHAITTATVRVSDVDDNAPVFHGSYSRQSISEDAPIGTSIAVFSATDADAAPNGRIHFSILEADGSDVVRMDSESGWLLVAAPLDRERRAHYDLVARAEDDAGNRADVDFRLEITDVNDEAPVFDEQSYSVEIDPSRLVEGQTIAKLKVTDADLPPFNATRLFISRGNEDGLFSIDEGGSLAVARLRFPENVHRYNLTVLAFDGKFSTSVPVTIKVKSVPRFECPSDDLQLEVRENTAMDTVIHKLASVGAMKWQLVSTEEVPFRVDGDELRVVGEVDAEIRSRYAFSLRSTSAVAGECWRRVSLRVADENDNRPVFTRKEYEVTVKENQPATPQERAFLVRVHAEDKDSGPLGRVHYTLSDGFGAFVMDSRSGAITIIRPLDREQREEYVLHVLASDGDEKRPRSSKAVVRVSVADQNDNPPVFERKEYSLQVMESESVGYELVRVEAEGGDMGETVTYALETGQHNKYVRLDKKTGVIKLAAGLDYETEKVLSFVVVATDSGTPPLSSKAIVNIQVLDENDNAPVFAKNSYKSEVKENAANGTKVIKVEASDADSEHYGRVVYSLSGGVGPFAVEKDGWIRVAGEIDYEEVTSYRLTIEARDGGNLTAEVTLLVAVIDENDNRPQFDQCNMTAVVQEGVTPGHVVQSVHIRDLDGPSFGGPFQIQLKGEGHRTFLVDEQQNIITAARLHHARKEKFLLTVIATDRGGLSTDCPLTVYVKEESRHPPLMRPLFISINTLKGEYRGGVVGRVMAEDKDSGDMLRFSMVDGSVRGPLPTGRVPTPTGSGPHTFKVDAENGEIWSEHGIPAGLHAFNVTVTDGKFNAVSYVQIEVVSIEQDHMDHAVSIRILEATPRLFFARLAPRFARVFSRHVNVRPENINILSVQEVDREGSRERRSVPSVPVPVPSPSSIDVLFTVSRGFDGVDRGMMKPDHIYSRLKQEFHAIAHESKMKFQLTTEVCTPGVCQRGECRERIELSDQEMTRVAVDGVAFVAPTHSRFAECTCPEGYGGVSCELELNGCSRSPCRAFEMCSANEESPLGFDCFCPPGTTGDRCAQPDCGNEGRCLEEAELSVAGNGYFEMSITNDVETRMELEVELRTVTAAGTLMYSHGAADYHSLDVVGGRLEYRWDAGSGQGAVKTNSQISDGKWHRVRISRRGRRTRLSVDETETHEGWSPSGAEVLNLQSASRQLVFGARVLRGGNATAVRVRDGVAACFRVISLDGRSLAKTRQGLRLHAASPGCRAMAATPCSDAPCQNGATCHAIGNTYSCLCPSRYEGVHCEVDREPCADQPCPVGIQCIPFYNQYLCKCPDGFTGKRCEGRGPLHTGTSDACAAHPCGESGDCISIPRQSVRNAGFICNCTNGVLQSTPCDGTSLPAILSSITLQEVIVVGSLLLLIFLIVLGIIIVCRCIKRRSGDPKYGEHVSVPHMRNPHVMPVQPCVQPAPPLPPRTFRGNKYSNLEQAQMTGLPTVQVRPFPANERVSSSRGDSRSPSLAGSGKQWKVSRDYGSAAEDIHQSGRGSYDAKALEALRRFGFRPSDDDASSVGSGSRVRRTDRAERRGRDAGEPLNQAESIQCLPTEDEPAGWNDGVDRIGEAVKQERLRLEGLTGRMQIGDTVLSPLVNDTDYMTMRPRRDQDSTERRPLLANQDRRVDGGDSQAPPPPPAHKNLFHEVGRLYDDPAADSRRMTSEYSRRDDSRATEKGICDIDASDEEEMPSDIAV